VFDVPTTHAPSISATSTVSIYSGADILARSFMMATIRALTARQAELPSSQQLVNGNRRTQISSHRVIVSPLSSDLYAFLFHNYPGRLSINGPQHGNDHVNIQDIQILPITDEILAVNHPPWMPKTNIVRLASISVRVANYLAGLQDSLNELQQLANILQENVIAEAFRYAALWTKHHVGNCCSVPGGRAPACVGTDQKACGM
jgi:hypothetical protein